MNQGDRTQRESEEARAERALRGLAPVTAEPAFRARLRRDFVAGEIAAPAPRLRVVGPRLPALATWALSAAAAVLVVTAGMALNKGPRWVATAPNGTFGDVLVDGEPIPASDGASLSEALIPGSRIEWGGSADLELRCPGTAVLQILPGSSLILPAPPPRWFARRIEGRLDAGEVRVTTGPRFHGAQFALATPEAEVEVRGTTLAVICQRGSTCVCVYEGQVRVAERDGTGAWIPAGRRRESFADGRPAVDAPILEAESRNLGLLRASERPSLERPGR